MCLLNTIPLLGVTRSRLQSGHHWCHIEKLDLRNMQTFHIWREIIISCLKNCKWRCNIIKTELVVVISSLLNIATGISAAEETNSLNAGNEGLLRKTRDRVSNKIQERFLLITFPHLSLVLSLSEMLSN